MGNKTELDLEEEMLRVTEEIDKLSTQMANLKSEIERRKERTGRLKDKLNKLKGDCYYVYIVFVNGVPKYAGKGTGDRYKHAITGASSVPELNKDFFNDEHIEVRILHGKKTFTEKEAIKEEKNVIGSLMNYFDLYNKSLPKEHEYSFMDCDFRDLSTLGVRNKNYEFPRDKPSDIYGYLD